MKFNFHVRTLDNKLLARRAHRRARRVAPWLHAKVNSLQYGYGSVSESPQRQRASEELGFFCEKNIYKQLAQLATARGNRGATETTKLRMLLFFVFFLFALCTNAKCIIT